MLQPKHLILPLSILLPLATSAPASDLQPHTTALLTAIFSPNCPSDTADDRRNSAIEYDPSPSLSFSSDDRSQSLDFSPHLDISSTAPLRPNVCVGLPVPLEYSSLLVDHFSVSASIQHPRPSRGGHSKKKEGKEKCKITVHELPGCEQEPVFDLEIDEGERRVESGCARRKFLAFELVWAKLSCEVEEDEHEDKDGDDEDEDEEKPWTHDSKHGGLANSTVPATNGKNQKGRLSGGKRRTKLPIF
ncbi:hypothetical protein N8T08_002973 [Aspergillus melleus]|uniref:Uncharacterized protein n=1 Tax=Aspergillus melleus TaxID=138277 RepID=A0ACC3B8W1_9EURO|nr:hypothetical protein N8T08_002973 [Aspergillus melleus]